MVGTPSVVAMNKPAAVQGIAGPVIVPKSSSVLANTFWHGMCYRGIRILIPEK